MSAYDRAVPLLALVPLVVGLVVAVVGVLGWLERLPRNRFAGVRTPATLRDDRAFRVANKVAGPPLTAAGLVGIASGAMGFAAGLVVVLVGFVGMIGIAVAGGVLGHRSAEALPDEKPELPEGCKGCACGGCDLAAAAKGSVGSDVSGVRGE
jgi:hypothetical protein